MQSFFAPAIDNMSLCLRKQYRQRRDVNPKYVFLVGGFSSSPLVQAAMRAELESNGCTVRVLARPEAAIVKGAVLFARAANACDKDQPRPLSNDNVEEEVQEQLQRERAKNKELQDKCTELGKLLTTQMDQQGDY